MSTKPCTLIVNNISLPFDAPTEEAFSVAEQKLRKINHFPKNAVFKIYRRSTDARKKNDIKFVYSVSVSGDLSGINDFKLQQCGISVAGGKFPEIEIGDEPLAERPVVIGTGPCGLFCALLLAENGYKPVVLERGLSVADRKKSVERFKTFKILDTESNIQFGAGGAGTFSDGKLVTRINDGMTDYVLERFVEFGADEDILYIAKPHIGTDVLCQIVEKMLKRIEALGGEVRYNTKFEDSNFSSSKLTYVYAGGEKIPVGAVVLAPGHSARDTYEMLIEKGVFVEAKNFSVGMRIEHLAKEIDKSMYGVFAGNDKLGHAEYNLSYNTKVRGVYTFCMCPGGEVVCAASESFGVVTNGMSKRARDGRNSNSAVVCSVFKEDYGATPTAAIAFQRDIERRAYIAGGSDYSAPVVTVGDFLSGKAVSEPRDVIPTYMDGVGVKIASPDKYLPSFVCENIKGALCAFDKKISGFAADGAVLSGAETRTSSPVRILRDDNTKLALGYENFYPAGEGAGYAGGITSASIDGIKVALALMKKFKPKQNG